ncbi:hypothetical protein [Streptomyces sp. t39]|uniref:hypothetical protein n=1 Tax=Streptomyces sp. t39 TaxID=1828156 RepID=UPI0011CE74D2|nr:hypothetical protein [Streptomyces sp. t39]TXS55226.1 hypothetical protein EAO77_02695 [Streptomyces sp. t39]
MSPAPSARLAELEDQEQALLLLLPTEDITDPGAREAWQQVAAVLGVAVPYTRPLDEEPIPYTLVDPTPCALVSSARLRAFLAPAHPRPGRRVR